MGPPEPYPSEEQRGSGGGLFSGKGLLGKAMKQAEKFGAGNIVGQAAGALGIGGGGHGGHGGQGGQGGYGGQGGQGGQDGAYAHDYGQGGNPYGGGPSPVSPQGGYQPSPYSRRLPKSSARISA
eukprot:TRINITY_DN13135_c0_g1_i1.p3 TRINITY_DN13135_c0_g1~~TRINITY_DN13135_c0_g1_i1.p3  ORF type:complete len:124 (+),score=35.62 TRINITY_DN13135_c0_g1_i1:413-784(+)